MNFLNMVDWNIDSFVCNAASVTRKDRSRSAVPTVGALGERRGLCPSCGARSIADSENAKNRCSHAHSEVWQCAKPERTPPYAVS